MVWYLPEVKDSRAQDEEGKRTPVYGDGGRLDFV